MKTVFTLLAFATASMASVVIPRTGGEGGHKGSGGPGGPGGNHDDNVQTMTTYTTTTVCPTTSTYIESGSTYCETEYVTSTLTVTDCANCEVTVTADDIYITETEVDYTYVTSYCPYTETKTVDGETETVTWTQTKVIQTYIPKTETVYTSEVTTVHVTTDAYTTVTCPEEVYTTVVKGVTVEYTETYTHTLTIEDEKTVTEVVPVTKTDSVYVTKTHNVDSETTVTSKITSWLTVSGTVYETIVEGPETETKYFTAETSAVVTTQTIAPGFTNSTTTVSSAPTETSAIAVSGAGEVVKNPVFALVAGLFALIALV